MAGKLTFELPAGPAKKLADFRALDQVPPPDDLAVDANAERLAAETRAFRETVPDEAAPGKQEAGSRLQGGTRGQGRAAPSKKPPPLRDEPLPNSYVGGRAQRKTTLVMPAELKQQLDDLSHQQGLTIQSLIFRALVETYGLEIDPRELVPDRRRRY